MSESLRDCVNTTQDDVSNRSIPKTAGFELMMSEKFVSESLRDCVNTTQDDVSNRSIPKTVGFELMMMKSVRITSRLREYYSGRCEQSIDTQDSGVRAHDEKCPTVSEKYRRVRITSRLREYYSGRCEQSIDTQESGVRAHDEKCPKNSKCPNHFAIA